ncbi:hypothetical protein [Brevundimonas balnearis]|uniref:Uncharacterized protein n=1 Tax=Brevundimonas balnearis TaxID=1572858 RepID=A0ABV6R716_9CAUL
MQAALHMRLQGRQLSRGEPAARRFVRPRPGRPDQRQDQGAQQASVVLGIVRRGRIGQLLDQSGDHRIDEHPAAQ